jgi:hypothetical protein
MLRGKIAKAGELSLRGGAALPRNQPGDGGGQELDPNFGDATTRARSEVAAGLG